MVTLLEPVKGGLRKPALPKRTPPELAEAAGAPKAEPRPQNQRPRRRVYGVRALGFQVLGYKVQSGAPKEMRL